jgi:hypothetical protein
MRSKADIHARGSALRDMVGENNLRQHLPKCTVSEYTFDTMKREELARPPLFPARILLHVSRCE